METCKGAGFYGDTCRGLLEECILFAEYIGGETSIPLEAFEHNRCPAAAIAMVRERKEREHLAREALIAKIEASGE